MGADSYSFCSTLPAIFSPGPAAATNLGDVEEFIDLPAKAAVQARIVVGRVPAFHRRLVAVLTALQFKSPYDQPPMYKQKRSPQGEFVPIRGLNYHIQRWEGAAGAAPALPPLVLLHGWMDVGASYQFMVDAFT